jgi:hypothetical protein
LYCDELGITIPDDFCENRIKQGKGICKSCAQITNKSGREIEKMVETRKMVVTESKICEACDEEFKPVSNAQRYCPECKDSQKEKKDKVKTESNLLVRLDFTTHPQIYKEIEKVALENFRPIGHQIMFMLVAKTREYDR